MGGKLQVESVHGAGSRFFFTVNFALPAVRQPQGDAREPQLRSLRLLVLDRDPSSRARLADMLRGMPVAKVSVPTVPAALAALYEGSSPEQPFDLVLIDGATAGVAGIEEVCRSIAGRKWHLPTLVTVLPDQLERVRQQSEQLGLRGILTTPVRDSHLLDGIVRALSRESREISAESRDRLPAPAGIEAPGNGCPVPAVVFEPARLAAEMAKLERLLARNSLDAKRQFDRFREELPLGAFPEELKALECCMDKLDFKKARHLLARFPGRPEQSLQEKGRESL